MKLFRKQRWSNIRNSRVVNYLLYAVGEILLVTIGILIALQINNANAERKQYYQETRIMQELLRDIKNSQRIIQETIANNTSIIHCLETVALYLQNDSAYSSELNGCFHMLVNWQSPYLPVTAYENLKSKGIDMIQDTTVKQAVTDLYGKSIPALLQDADRNEWVFLQTVSYPLYVRYVRSLYPDYEAEPIDFEALKADVEFANWLSHLMMIRRSTINFSYETQDELRRVMELLTEELDTRTKK